MKPSSFVLSCFRVFVVVFPVFNFDELVKSPKTPFSVIPVKTGIQEIQEFLDSRSPPARGQASRE
jgi:hypothetical protein